ncbi:MAG TPA: Tex-like N-terminal domain-containing protein, partial [Longimicrobiales bacterium]
MLNDDLTQRVAAELSIAPWQVQRALALFDEAATVPFVARYRKEVTGGLDEVRLRAIEERAAYLSELEERRAAIQSSIQEQGKLDDALRARILAAETKQALEDLYLPFKPKRRTRATIAREKGYEPLADRIWYHAATDADVADEAADALQGARDILAERVSEDADIRAWVRDFTRRTGVLASRGKHGVEKNGSKFADYFEFSQKLSDLPSHRVLAIRRGET